MKITHIGFTVNGVSENVQKLLWEGLEHLCPDCLASIIMYNTYGIVPLSKPVYIFMYRC